MPKANQSELDIKLSWEIRKLQAEVEALNRPFKNPSVIAALTTATLVALVSCGGLLIQWSRSDRDYTLAQIRTERLKLESEKLQAESEKLQVESKKLQAQSKELETKRAALESEIASRQHHLQTVMRRLKSVEAALSKASISENELKQASLDISAARDALVEASEAREAAFEAATTVYYIVDTYKKLADLGVIKRTGLPSRNWRVIDSGLTTERFVGAQRQSLSEIVIPASPSVISVLTPHDRASWRIVPLSHDKAKIQITNPDRFWAGQSYLVIAVKE